MNNTHYDLTREETDTCQKLTPGCPVDHRSGEPETDCDTW